MTAVRCADCHRLVRVRPVYDQGDVLGVKCAQDRGLLPASRPRAARPARTTDPEQPSLLDQLNDEGVMTMTENAENPQHLQAESTDRGFDHLHPIPSEYGGEVQVYESSAADGPHVWLKATAPVDLSDPAGPAHTVPIHLTAENAWKLADQLRHLVEEHYQGDARPEWSR